MKRNSLFMDKEIKFKDFASYRSKHRKTGTSEGKSEYNDMSNEDNLIKIANVAQLLNRESCKKPSKMPNFLRRRKGASESK